MRYRYAAASHGDTCCRVDLLMQLDLEPSCHDYYVGSGGIICLSVIVCVAAYSKQTSVE